MPPTYSKERTDRDPYELGPIVWAAREGRAATTLRSGSRRAAGRGRAADRAFDLRAEARGAALSGLRPRAVLPGWLVTHVLTVTAGELRDPVSLRILS